MGKDAPSSFTQADVSSMGVQREVSGEYRTKSTDPSTGPAKYALGLARVVRVDYVKHHVQLQVMSGEKDYFDWSPIPAAAPAAGARHFMGSLPEPGDVAVIGWLSSESKHPMILAYLPVGVSSGYEWLPLQSFLPDEVDMNPKTLTEFEGIYGRYRHKMRPMRSGMIVMSSSQGSDIVMDEGVLITNRRATEIRLRDQDQAGRSVAPSRP